MMTTEVWKDQVGIVPFVQTMDTVGDGSGTTEILGDFSAAAETFEVAGPTAADEHLVIVRVMVYTEDNASIDVEGYGGAAALTNGLTLDVTDSAGASVVDLTPTPIKSNGDWGAYCFDTAVDTWGQGDQAFKARWTFSKFTDGSGLWLNNGQKLVLTANDSFVSLVAHRVIAQGYRRGPGVFY